MDDMRKEENKEKEVNIMKIRTKLAILLIAAILSFAGFGTLINALGVDKVMAAATPTTEMTVSITG
jgi:hypothetical protein